MHKFFSVCLLILLIGIPSATGATPSVGIGNGKIQTESQIQPGSVVSLSQLSVLNDGTSAGSFFIEVTNNENQPQHKLSSDWFAFSPQKFELGPGETKLVDIRLAIPPAADPGEYFGYIEASVRSASGGMATVNAVSASKLFFSVADAKPVVPVTGESPSDIYKLGADTPVNRIFADAPR